MSVIFVKSILAAVGILATLLIYHRKIRTPSCIGIVIVLFYTARITSLLLLHLAFRWPVPPDTEFYYNHAIWLLEGQVPNRDFSSPYGFLFTYLLAVPVAIVRQPVSISILFQSAEALGAYFIFRTLRGVVGQESAGRACVLYLVNPLVLVSLWLTGQDECLLILVLGVALLLIRSSRSVMSGILAALLFYLTKLFSIWTLGPMMLTRPRRAWYGAVATAVVVTGVAIGIGSNLFSVDSERSNGVDELGKLMTSGNIWYLISFKAPHLAASMVPAVVTLVALGAAGASLCALRRAMDDAVFVLYGTALFTMVFQCTYRMTFGQYVSLAVPAFLALFALRPRYSYVIPLMAVWTAFLALDHTVYYRVFRGANDIALPAFVIFVVCQVLLVAGNWGMLGVIGLLARDARREPAQQDG